MQPIDPNTLITRGLPISDNFLIDHLTSGAYHYVLGKWAPNFTSVLQGFQQQNGTQIPIWKIASNLQLGAQYILEPLLKEFGSDLILRTGLTPNNLGQSFGIQVAGFQGNMFNLMPDIQKIASRASNISLVQGSSSFANIQFNPSSIIKSSGGLPSISSIDVINNLQLNGLQTISGFL